MYCFGQSIGSLDDAQLGKRWNDLMGSGVRLQPFLRSFPNIARLVLALPKQVTNLVPLYREATDFIGTAAAQQVATSGRSTPDYGATFHHPERHLA